MKTTLFFVLFFVGVLLNAKPKSLYEIQVQNIKGESVSLSKYRGQVLLIVNTASQCGFTPQLQDLETLYQKYKSRGFEVLAFPSHDFKQDPAQNDQILSFARKNFNTTFPFFEKGPVTGEKKQPLYQFLTSQKSAGIFTEIKWNFEKFLVGREGQVIDRWMSMMSPTSPEIVNRIERALEQK